MPSRPSFKRLNYFIRVSSVFLLTFAGPAYASLIELDFSGIVGTSTFGAVPSGSTFTGTLFYDSAAIPNSSDNCGGICSANFFSVTGPITLNFTGSSVSATVCTFDCDVEAIQGTNGNTEDSIHWIYSNSPAALSPPNVFAGTGPIAPELEAFDILDVGFDSTTSVLGSPQIPAIFPGIGEWSLDASIAFGTRNVEGGQNDLGLSGTITDVSSSAIPEPSALPPCLLAIGAVVWRYRKARKMEHLRPRGH